MLQTYSIKFKSLHKSQVVLDLFNNNQQLHPISGILWLFCTYYSSLLNSNNPTRFLHYFNHIWILYSTWINFLIKSSNRIPPDPHNLQECLLHHPPELLHLSLDHLTLHPLIDKLNIKMLWLKIMLLLSSVFTISSENYSKLPRNNQVNRVKFSKTISQLGSEIQFTVILHSKELNHQLVHSWGRVCHLN